MQEARTSLRFSFRTLSEEIKAVTGRTISYSQLRRFEIGEAIPTPDEVKAIQQAVAKTDKWTNKVVQAIKQEGDTRNEQEKLARTDLFDFTAAFLAQTRDQQLKGNIEPRSLTQFLLPLINQVERVKTTTPADRQLRDHFLMKLSVQMGSALLDVARPREAETNTHDILPRLKELEYALLAEVPDKYAIHSQFYWEQSKLLPALVKSIADSPDGSLADSLDLFERHIYSFRISDTLGVAMRALLVARAKLIARGELFGADAQTAFDKDREIAFMIVSVLDNVGSRAQLQEGIWTASDLTKASDLPDVIKAAEAEYSEAEATDTLARLVPLQFERTRVLSLLRTDGVSLETAKHHIDIALTLFDAASCPKYWEQIIESLLHHVDPKLRQYGLFLNANRRAF